MPSAVKPDEAGSSPVALRHVLRDGRDNIQYK